MRPTLLIAAALLGGTLLPVVAEEPRPTDRRAPELRQLAEEDAYPHARRRWNAAHDDEHHARRRWNAANPPAPVVRSHRPELTRPMVQPIGAGGANAGGRAR